MASQKNAAFLNAAENLPDDIKFLVLKYVYPRRDLYDKNVYRMNRRFKVLKSHINFSCKNQLPLAKYLLNQKYDNVSYQRWMAGCWCQR